MHPGYRYTYSYNIVLCTIMIFYIIFKTVQVQQL